MASPNFYAGGIGGSTGSTLACAPRFIGSSYIWYVSSTTGSDAANPRGAERIRPLATLSQAYTNAGANDIIVLLAGHTETLTSGQTFGKAGIAVIGEGTGTSRPRFTANAAITLFDVTAAGCLFDNIYFKASTTIAPTKRMGISAAGVQVLNCYFECGTLDTTPAMELTTGAGQVRLESTMFVSTSSSTSSQPLSGLKVTNGVSDLVLDSVVFDGGTSGWSDPYAFNGAAAITRMKGINCMFLNDSDITLATGTTGYLAERDPTGSVRIVWTA